MAERVIDAHVHVWTPDTAHYPLAEGYKKEDMKPATFTPDDLFKHTKPAGVDSPLASVRARRARSDGSFRSACNGSMLTGSADSSSSAFGAPVEAVTWRKQQRLRHLARLWLMARDAAPLGGMRFDVASVLAGRIEIVEDAF